MRPLALILALCACGDPLEVDPQPDGGREPPETGPIQWVERGTYDLEWEPVAPASHVGCTSMELHAERVDFTGQGCIAPDEEIAPRENCACSSDWCLCPNVGALYAEIAGVPVRAYLR